MKTNTPAPKRPGLMQIAVDVVSRSDVASRAVQIWKSNPAVRKSFASVADLYDALAEMEEHQAIRLPGKNQEGKK